MTKGEWRSVHTNGNQSVPPVEGGVDRESAGPTIDATAEHLLGRFLNPGLAQYLGQ